MSLDEFVATSDINECEFIFIDSQGNEIERAIIGRDPHIIRKGTVRIVQVEPPAASSVITVDAPKVE